MRNDVCANFKIVQNYFINSNRFTSKKALAVRRHNCENVDADPLVWTNQRFIRWARNIDLGEYADNLKGKVTAHVQSILFRYSCNVAGRNLIKMILEIRFNPFILKIHYYRTLVMEVFQL